MIAADLVPLAYAVDKLRLLPGNPRRGNVEAVKRSLAAFGQRKPIVVRRSDRVVIAGNHTLQAAQALGWAEVAVVWVDDDDTTSKAFALADNRTAELGDYDEAALADLIGQVGSVDPELLAASGWDEASVAELLAVLEPDVLPLVGDPDEVPEQVVGKSVPGDVWLLGSHRVMCGDSTSPTDVEKLMAGAKADMVWTDPPYGVTVVGRTSEALTIKNDNLDLESLEQLLRDAFSNACDFCNDGAVWYVAAPPGVPFISFAKPLLDLGIWRHTLAWVKDSLVMSRADYHYRHESIFYGWKPGAAHQEPPDRKQDTIWEFARPKRSSEHPTMKPIELVVRAINNSSRKKQIVLDSFGGSGSTLIAAHQTNRVAYLMELDPKYVDVICARFQKVTGIKPVSEATGREHDFLDG
jgi:DNA modification methylase